MAILIIINVTFASPFAVWMLKAFFKMIPNEIEEAAYIDGASRLRILYSIILPLASPGIASIAIFCFIISWTEYMFASILISGDDMRTMPVGLASIVGQYQIDWGFLLAGATIASLPVIILFIFWFGYRKIQNNTQRIHLLIIGFLVFVQLVIGVMVVLTNVEISMGSLHQIIGTMIFILSTSYSLSILRH